MFQTGHLEGGMSTGKKVFVPNFFRSSNQVQPLLPSRPFCMRHPNLGFRHLIPSAAGGPLLAPRRIVQSPIWFKKGVNP
jgi:hypothetical protein